jgi:chemotaxis protein MotA
MDAATIIGLLLGVGCVWYTMASGQILNILWDLPSFILVIGGTIASTLMTYPLDVMKKAPRTLIMTFFPKKRHSPHAIIDRICSMSEISVTRGIDVLPEELHEDDDDFLRAGVRMLINDWSADDIQTSMDREMGSMLERHQSVQKAFASAGGYAPTYGLLGTLVGVLGVLRYLGDPTAMGKSMTVAIITTFYGIFLANFICLPTAGKLESYSNKELLNKQLVLIGILAMKREEHANVIRQKLEQHLSQSLRRENSKESAVKEAAKEN